MIGEAVQTSKGLKRFFVLFCLFALAGIFTNKFIQKTVQSHWVDLNQQMLQQNISVANPRVVFARWGLPTFGAWIDTVNWRRPEECRELRVAAKDIFIPIPFWDLLFSRPKAGAISVSKLIVEHKPDRSCEHGPLPVSPGNDDVDWQPNKPASEGASAKTWTSARLERQIADLKKWRGKIPFSKLEFDSIEFLNVNLSGKILSGHGEGVVSSGDTLRLDFEFRPLVIQKGKKNIATKLTVAATVAEDKLSGQVDWSYDEGHLFWTSQVDGNNKIESKFKLDNLPLSVVNRWLGTPWTFQFLWANCSLALNTDLKNFETQSWVAKDCDIKGPQGQISITNVNLPSLIHPTNLKVDVIFKDFKVDGVVKAANELPLAGTFKKFGTVSGGMYFRDRELTSKLRIKGPEILFSKNNRRTLQEVESMDLSGTYVNKKWNVELANVKFKGGEFEGAVYAVFDKTTQSWDTRLNIAALAFSPEVQDIMIGGRLSPLAVTGVVAVGPHGKIQNVDLRGQFKDAKLDGVTVTDGAFFADHNGEGFRLGVSAAKVDIPRGTLTDWLFVTLVDRAQITDRIVVSRLHGDAVVSGGKLIFKKVAGTAFNGRVTVSGEFASKFQQGTLEWSLPKYQYQWEWERDGTQVTLYPASDNLRDWLQINKDFSKEFQGVRILSQRENKGS